MTPIDFFPIHRTPYFYPTAPIYPKQLQQPPHPSLLPSSKNPSPPPSRGRNNIPDNKPQNPTIHPEKKQRGNPHPGKECAVPEKLETVPLPQPQGLGTGPEGQGGQAEGFRAEEGGGGEVEGEEDEVPEEILVFSSVVELGAGLGVGGCGNRYVSCWDCGWS